MFLSVVMAVVAWCRGLEGERGVPLGLIPMGLIPLGQIPLGRISLGLIPFGLMESFFPLDLIFASRFVEG